MKKHMKSLIRKAPQELVRDLEEARSKLTGLRFDRAQGKVKNVEEMRLLKKAIARMLTILNKPAAND